MSLVIPAKAGIHLNDLTKITKNMSIFDNYTDQEIAQAVRETARKMDQNSFPDKSDFFINFVCCSILANHCKNFIEKTDEPWQIGIGLKDERIWLITVAPEENNENTGN